MAYALAYLAELMYSTLTLFDFIGKPGTNCQWTLMTCQFTSRGLVIWKDKEYEIWSLRRVPFEYFRRNFRHWLDRRINYILQDYFYEMKSQEKIAFRTGPSLRLKRGDWPIDRFITGSSGFRLGF